PGPDRGHGGAGVPLRPGRARQWARGAGRRPSSSTSVARGETSKSMSRSAPASPAGPTPREAGRTTRRRLRALPRGTNLAAMRTRTTTTLLCVTAWWLLTALVRSGQVMVMADAIGQALPWRYVLRTELASAVL